MCFCRATVLAALALGSAACHHSTTLSATDEQDAYGIWTGTDNGSGLDLVGIVNTADQAVFVRADGQQYTGTVTVLQNNISANLESYAQFGTTFSDGSTFGVGSLGGTVSTQGSLDGTFGLTTLGNTTSTTTWTLAYDAIYTKASSLGAIAGSYTDVSKNDPSYGATVAISSTGALSVATAPSNGCVLSGQVTVPNTLNDIYTVTLSYANCTGTTYDKLNGIHFTGVGIITSASPAQVLVAVTGQSNTQLSYGLVMTLNAT
jgi:hypothetical protein